MDLPRGMKDFENSEFSKIEFVREKFGNLQLNVRCMDDWGNWNVDEYLIQMCVKPGPDLMPPLVKRFEPASGTYLKYEESSKEVLLYTNEPADCRYDFEDTNYSNMANQFSCNITLEDQEAWGWPCAGVIKNLTNSQNIINIRCKDKPWLPESNETRVENQQSYVYLLEGSESPLSITSLLPNSTVTRGGEPVSITMTAETRGGAEDGKSNCQYKWADNYISFSSTFASTHSQKFSTLIQGIYQIPIKCEDVAGNIAESNASFTLEIDETPPEISRVFKEGQNLRVVTTEDAACYYSATTCGFNLNNGTSMTTGYSRTHLADWDEGIVYYIKCEDVWGHENNGCAMVVRPSLLMA